jgi:hypothetical protein
MFEEFPKCLYASGEYDGAYVIVFSEDEQAESAKSGFYPLGEVPKKARKQTAVVVTDGADQLQ